MNLDSSIESWGSLACTINRVRHKYHGQFILGGQYDRESDINLINSSGIEMLRYPVAERFAWLDYHTPLNEPLTTARFCGLHGHLYPHHTEDYSFYQTRLSKCKASILSIKIIRQHSPYIQQLSNPYNIIG